MRSSTNASLYNIAHCNLFVIRALVALFKREPNTRDRAIIESAARNFSTRHCSLRPIPPHHQIAHACSIACLSHSMRFGDITETPWKCSATKSRYKAIEM